MIRIVRFAKAAAWGVVLGWVFLGSAQAAIITLTDPGVNYDLQYDEADLGLYGAPIIGPSGKVEFTPTNFRASSAFGAGLEGTFISGGVAQTQSALTITFIAHTGFGFDGVTLDEGGTYKLNGATSIVAASGNMTVYEGGTTTGASAFGSIVSGTTFVNDNVSHQWVASASGDLTGVEWDGISSVDVVVANTLTAVTESGFNEAEIKKETTSGTVSLGIDMNGGAGAVPVPAAVWLFASGLFGLVGVARRKGRQSA